MQIRIYFIDLRPNEASLERCLSDLSPAEVARAQRYRLSLIRGRFILAHSALRQILCQELSLKDCPSLLIATHSLGKPYLPDYPQLAFSLSHSGDLAAVAVTVEPHSSCPEIQANCLPDKSNKENSNLSLRDNELGLDLESRQEHSNCLSLARRFFSPTENRYLEALDGDPSLNEEFLQIWTRKEAFTKALGTGLHTPLTSFSVPCGPCPHPKRVDYTPDNRWQVLAVALPQSQSPSYICSLCAAGDFTVSSHRFVLPAD